MDNAHELLDGKKRQVTCLPHPALKDFIKCYAFLSSENENEFTQSFVPLSSEYLMIYIYYKGGLNVSSGRCKNFYSSGVVGLYERFFMPVVEPVPCENLIGEICVVLTFSGLYRFTSLCGNEIVNNIIRAEIIFGNKLCVLQEELNYASGDIMRKNILDLYFMNFLKRKPLKNESRLILLEEVLNESQGRVALSNLAGQMNVSYRSLERLFERDLGVNASIYLKIYRINKALRMMALNMDMDIYSIIINCGYYDHAHFIKDFKSVTGYTPRHFLLKTKKNYYSSRALLVLEHGEAGFDYYISE